MKKNILFTLLALVTVLSMVLSACAAPAAPTEAPAAPAKTEVPAAPAKTEAPAAPAKTEAPAPTEAPAETEAPAPTEAPKATFKACQVTDTGGIDDKSFNATAWRGVQQAMDEYGIEGKYLESQQQTDYEKNINAFIEEGCDIIIPVGFLLGDATKAAAEKNPDQKFTIVDVTYDPVIPNVLGQEFAVNEAGFLAGYVAAGISKTGKIGTFGGIQFPAVTAFMDGYVLGAKYYNEKHGTNVEVLGWDVETQTGLFTGNFESTDDGRTMGETLMDEGADVIMPVAGPVGLGTAAAAKERGNAYIVGVDSDWYLTAPEFKDIVLTSILKNMDVLTKQAIQMSMDGSFKGGALKGTLENGGVGLAPYHDMEAMVSAELQDEVKQLTADIIAGKVATQPGAAPAAGETTVTAPEGFKACQVTDTGGIDDKSFNATAWKGVQDSIEKFGIEGKYLESQQQTDYEKNINAFIDEGCNIIITVGFLLGDGTKAAAEANPKQPFSIVDYAYDPAIPNVVGQVFSTDQASFLAGYLAAGVSKTGKVGTFGGIQIPTVTAFMDGFALGVKYYNEKHGTNVEVLGWDPAAQTGLFTGNFESTDDGRTMGETLMDEGADIIMPVAGPVGLGTAAAAKERGNAYIIGVDADMYLTAPEYKDIILTSVLKNMNVTTVQAIQSVIAGAFEGGVIAGTLENGGVGLAPYHDLESLVSAELQAEIEQLTADIIAGTVPTSPSK